MVFLITSRRSYENTHVSFSGNTSSVPPRQLKAPPSDPVGSHVELPPVTHKQRKAPLRYIHPPHAARKLQQNSCALRRSRRASPRAFCRANGCTLLLREIIKPARRSNPHRHCQRRTHEHQPPYPVGILGSVHLGEQPAVRMPQHDPTVDPEPMTKLFQNL